MPSAGSELAERIAKALKTFSAFVFHRDLDPPPEVLGLIRELGLAPLLTVSSLPGGYYVIAPNTRPCAIECKLRVCREAGEDEKERCMLSCLEDCRSKLVDRIVEVLKGRAGR